MSEGIIHFLESVEIDHQQAQNGVESTGPLKSHSEAVIEQEAIGKAGEHVVLRQVAQAIFAQTDGLGLLRYTMSQHKNPCESHKGDDANDGEDHESMAGCPPGRGVKDGNVVE